MHYLPKEVINIIWGASTVTSCILMKSSQSYKQTERLWNLTTAILFSAPSCRRTDFSHSSKSSNVAHLTSATTTFLLLYRFTVFQSVVSYYSHQIICNNLLNADMGPFPRSAKSGYHGTVPLLSNHVWELQFQSLVYFRLPNPMIIFVVLIVLDPYEALENVYSIFEISLSAILTFTCLSKTTPDVSSYFSKFKI